MQKILFFTLCIALLLLGLQYTMPALVHSDSWLTLLFIAGLTLSGHWITERITSKAKENLVLAFFGMMTLRLIASAAFIIWMSFRNVPDLILFATVFVVLYFFFLGLEIYILVTNLRRNSQS